MAGEWLKMRHDLADDPAVIRLADVVQLIANELEMNPSTVRPRRIELARRGLIVEDGTRRTSSGRMACVWKATAASR